MTIEFIVGVAGALLGAIGWLYQSYRSLVSLRAEHEKMMGFMERVNQNLEALWQESRATRKFYKWAVRQVSMARAKQVTPTLLVARVGRHKYSGNSIRELLTKIRGQNNVMLSGDFTLPRSLIAKAQATDASGTGEDERAHKGS